ncbi:MAG: hypothetical protein NC132_02415 [Corallococcus sp.]|nr:hypothetical protein [Corallococcus sp.]MCM1358962.1 hypothetical protein [Corallococcus sp.]MCM1394951.1 hypothetical protein [Corallococcus sp.]
MSNICLFNLPNLINYDELNNLANRLIKISIKNKIGIIFNSHEYNPSLTQKENFKNFFWVTDSFIDCNSDFLDMPLNHDLRDINKCKKAFIKRFGFLNDIIFELKNANIMQVDIYLSTDGSDNIDDFVVKQIPWNVFLSEFFYQILENANEYAYEVPTTCFTIKF